MSESQTCGLCLVAASRSSINRVGGIDLCDRCYHGGCVQAAELRGFQIKVTIPSYVVGARKVYVVRAEASIAEPLFRVGFYRKHPLVWLWSLLGMGIRVEDPLFHKIGTIIAHDKKQARQFMASDGAQSAVMDLLGEDVSIVFEQSGRIRISGQREAEPYDPTVIEREIAVLLVHVHRFCQPQAGKF